MQIFHPSTNTIARASVFGALFMAGAGLFFLNEVNRSPYVTNQSVARDQPVPFYHSHHVGDVGIDCRYCHTSVEQSSYAGIPPTKTCMNCHSQLFADVDTLEPVRESWRTGSPIPWTKVHDLPDYVYFDHSIHVAKGVGCETCHGRLDRMAFVWQEAPLTMEWCLDCHNDPGPNLRPRDAIYELGWKPPEGVATAELAARLLDEYDVHARVDCSTCHR